MTTLPPRSDNRPRRATDGLDPHLATGLEEAIANGLLVAAEPPAAHAVEFRHERIARAVVADLLPLQRPRYHAALAAALHGSPSATAGHWLAAHRPVLARKAAVEAAAEAELMAAPEDAIRYLELALELSEAAASELPGEEPTIVDLEMRAAEAAFAARRPARAVAFAEASIAALDERADRVRVGLLYERLGRYLRATGDHDAAVAAHRRAVELIPREPSPERALVLASLAQVMMLDGTFSAAERYARDAIRIGAAVGDAARLHVLHATTTLGVVAGWGDAPETGVELLRGARAEAEALGRLDDMFRATANLTTVLDLLGRREEAVEIANEGIEAARRFGQEAVYGNFLGANAADTLFLLGRWDEARALSHRSLEWSPTGASHVNAVLNLAIVEVESNAGELAGQLLGQVLLELEMVRDIAVRRAGLPGGRVARHVERRPSRRPPGDRAGLGCGSRDRGLDPCREDRGRVRGRRGRVRVRGPGAARLRRHRHGPRADRARPGGSRTGRPRVPRLAERRIPPGGGGVPRDGPCLPRQARGTGQCRGLVARRSYVDGAR